jgi:hypothetical protein
LQDDLFCDTIAAIKAVAIVTGGGPVLVVLVMMIVLIRLKAVIMISCTIFALGIIPGRIMLFRTIEDEFALESSCSIGTRTPLDWIILAGPTL